MTKKINSKFFIVAVLVLLLVLISAFIFVSTNTSKVAYAIDPPATATWNGDQATWSQVDGATGYQVSLFNRSRTGSLFATGTTDLYCNMGGFFVPEDTYYFTVAAYDDLGQSTDAISEDKIISGTKGAMSAVQITSTTVSWEYVDYATGYDIWILKKNSSGIYEQQGSILNTLVNNIDVDAQLRQYGYGDYKVEVQAYKAVSGNYLTQKGEATKDGWYAPLQFSDDPSFDIPVSYVGINIKDVDLSGAVSGGKPPYTFSNSDNLLPDGVAISVAGVISGAPTTPQVGNNAKIIVDDQSTGGSQFIMIQFGEVKTLSDNEIEYISIGAQKALKGNYISGELSTLKLPENAKYSIVEAGLKWWNYTTGSDCTGETFNDTGDYEVRIKVTPNAGNSFIPEYYVTGKVNGISATVEKESDTIYVLKYRFGVATDPAEYTITYDKGTDGGGSMPVGTELKAYEERPYTLPANGFTPTPGKEFDYWQISADSTKKYYPGNTFVFTANATITAFWKDINYTITYVEGSASGGTGALAAMATTRTYNESYNVSSDLPLTRTGYRQTGWSTTGEKDDNTGKVTDPISVTDNITFYPVWIQTFTVTYVAGSATGGEESYPEVYTLDKGETHNVATPSPLAKAEHRLTGWSDVAENTSNQGQITQIQNIAANVILYPVWVQTFIVTYKVGSNSPGNTADCPEPVIVDSGAQHTVSTLYPFTRDSHTHVGWGTEENENNTGFADEKITVNSNVDLYPIWKIKTYSVTYNTDSANEGQGTVPTGDKKTHNQKYTIKATPDLKKTGYNLLGWKIGLEGDGVKTEIPAVTNADTILYPVWEIQKFKITINIYNADYGSVDKTEVENVPYGAPLAQSGNSLLVSGVSEVVATPNPSNDTDDYVYILYTFYIEGEAVVKSSKTVIAWFGVKPKITYERGEYGVGILPAWGRKEFNKPYNVSTSYPLTRTGYKQVGWGYEESTDITKKVDKIHDLIDEIKTLYPIWQIQKYTINFNSNEGSAVDAITQDYDTAVSKPNDPTRPGYGFSGWYTTAELNVAYNFVRMPGENITVHAGWTANNNTIVFDGSGCPGNTMANQTIATDAKENLNANTYVWPGRTFEGWTKTANSTEVDFLNGAEYTMGTEASYTLWAVWSINKYTVTFLNEDGTVAVPTKDDYIYDEVIIGPEGDDPTKEADNTYTYEFIGWGTWTAGTRVKENVEYRATFKSTYIEYKVKWLNHDGSTIKTDSLHYNQLPRFTGAVPTKAADKTYTYTFNGWDNAVVNVAGNAEYTATFSKEYRKYTVTFYADDGETEILKKADYHYGDVVTKPANPTKAADAANTYEFAGWDKAVVNVAGNASYKATFNATKKEYEVTFANATVTGVDTPPTTIKDGDEITVTADAAPEGKKFDGWYVNGEKVSDDINFTYTFDATKGNVALEARYVDVVTEDVSGDNDPIAEIEADNKKGGLGGGAIAGIVIACLVVSGVGGFAIYWFVIKKKTLADLIKIFNKKAKKEGKAEKEEAEDKK